MDACATDETGRDTAHPGALLRCHVLPSLHLSVSEASRDLGIARQTLHRILSERAAITSSMATRLERFCGVPRRFWLDRQIEYELRHLKPGRRMPVPGPLHTLSSTVLRQIGASGER